MVDCFLSNFQGIYQDKAFFLPSFSFIYYFQKRARFYPTYDLGAYSLKGNEVVVANVTYS